MGNGICCTNQYAILNTLNSINNPNSPIISNSSLKSDLNNSKDLNIIIPYDAFNNIFFFASYITKIQSFYRGYKKREEIKAKLEENKNIVVQIPLIPLTKQSTSENINSNNEMIESKAENTIINNNLSNFLKFKRSKSIGSGIDLMLLNKKIGEINYEGEEDIQSEISGSSQGKILSLKQTSISPKSSKTIHSLDSFSSLAIANIPFQQSPINHKFTIKKSFFNQTQEVEINGQFTLKKQKGLNFSKIKDGFNIIKWKDGSTLTSIFAESKINGVGKFYNKEKETLFSGFYNQNIPQGYGLLQIKNNRIEGIWDKNYINTYGIELWYDQNYYQGEYLNNKKHGVGLYRWPDGTTYEGEWDNNKMNGYGIFSYFDDRIYSGKINNGNFEGVGIFKWKNGDIYFGEYENNEKNGFGIYIWSKKPLNAFCGFFIKGIRDGVGIRIIGKNIKYGIWKDGKIDEWLHGVWDFKNHIKKEQLKFVKYFKKSIIGYLKNFDPNEYFYTIMKMK